MGGRHADTRGAKHAVVAGLLASAAAGVLYLLSLRFVGNPEFSVAILLFGRALLGAGESFIITGAQTWGLALVGARNTGKVLAWMGTAMYAAFALGAPIGTTLYGAYGFTAIALATTLMPLATLLLAAPVRRVAPTGRTHAPLRKVIAAVWVPGLGLALSSVGFGAMTAFVSLLFAAREWTVWPAFTTFAVAFILARVFLGHLADKVGGARVALVFVLIEAAGQALLWAAPWSGLALVGAALTGFGYSLVYPALAWKPSGVPRREPGARDGCVHRLSRPDARDRESRSRPHRRRCGNWAGVPRERHRRALCRCSRAATCPSLHQASGRQSWIGYAETVTRMNMDLFLVTATSLLAFASLPRELSTTASRQA